VEAALGLDGIVVEVFATVEASERYADLRATATRCGVSWVPVADRALAALSDAVTPAGVVAVCRFLDAPLAGVLAESRLVAICADVRDPGNAGTVVRTADAAGADGVVLAGTSVDAYNPKTVRASAGSLFHLPIAAEPDVATAVRAAQAAGLMVLAADGAGEVVLDADVPATAGLLARRTAWLFGNEARGLPEDLAALADHRVRIPIHGRAESLNLATAAALCLYASATQHRR